MSERYQLVVAGARVGGPAFALAFFIGLYLHVERGLGAWGFVGVLLLGGLVGFALGLLVYLAARHTGTQLVSVITASGGLPPAPSFSRAESLVARGKPGEARAEYEARLRAEPGDVNARLALARLWREQLARPDKAQELYLEARRLGASDEQEFVIANALIDLYRARGDEGRELAELARFAERFAGTDAGRRAREALQRIKRERAAGA